MTRQREAHNQGEASPSLFSGFLRHFHGGLDHSTQLLLLGFRLVMGAGAVALLRQLSQRFLQTKTSQEDDISGIVASSHNHIRPLHIASHHITSHHITSHHIASHHITSHHITSHNITSHHIA
jgi:hypothetical protein